MNKTASRLRLGLILAGLVMVLIGRPLPVASGFALIVILTLAADRKAFRRVGKPRFWIFSLLVLALAGLWLGRNPLVWHGIRFSVDGLRSGVLMVARAFAMILCLVSISRSVSRDRFLSAAERFGLPHYPAAFQTAVETVPRMLESIRKLRGESKVFSLTRLADLLLSLKRLARDEPAGKPQVFAVTGGIGAGKTVWLNSLAERARAAGINVSGFIQPRLMDDYNRTTGYDLRSLSTAETVWIARRKADAGFEFNQAAFARGAEWLDNGKDCELLIVDELGRLEARGEGHWRALERLLSDGSKGAILVAAVRKDALELFRERLSFNDVLDLDDAEADREAFSTRVLTGRSQRARGSEMI